MTKWFSVFLSFVLISCWLACLSHAATPILSSKHDSDGDLTIVIDLNVGSKKSQAKKKQEQNGQPKIDSLSKKAASIIENSVSSKDATQISEDILVLANEIRNIANMIPSNEGQEKKDLKDQLTIIVSNLVQQAETPKALLLESSLALVAQQKKQQEQIASSSTPTLSLLENKQNRAGAATLLIPTSPMDWVALGLNVVDDIGTYSQKFNKVGEFMSGPVAKKLEKWNMKSLATISKSTGGSISTYSKKLEPYEQKAAKFIAPVVKSTTFQVVKKSANVVSGVLSIHGGLKSLHLIKGGGVKLPTNFAALKQSLASTVAKSNQLIQNSKKFITSGGKMTKIVGASKQALNNAGRLAKMNAVTFKRMSTWNKIKHVDGVKGIYDAAGDFKDDYKNVKKSVADKNKKKTQQITRSANGRQQAVTRNNRNTSVSSRNTNRRNTNTRNTSNRTNNSRSTSNNRSSSRNTRNSNSSRNNSRQTNTRTSTSSRSSGQRNRSSSGRNSSKPATQKRTNKSSSNKKKGGQ